MAVLGLWLPDGVEVLALEVDLGRGLQLLFKPGRPVQRRGAAQPEVGFPNLLGYRDELLGGDLLHDALSREEAQQGLGRHGLQGPGVQGRREGLRQVVLYVVVVAWKLVLREDGLQLRLAHEQSRFADRFIQSCIDMYKEFVRLGYRNTQKSSFLCTIPCGRR